MRVWVLGVLCFSCGLPLRELVTGGGSGGGGTGGGGGSGGGQAGGGVIVMDGLPLKNACSTLNAKRCEYYARCGLIEDSDPARRDCAAWLLATWCGPTRWPSRVEVGTLLYDGKFAQTCADAWSTRACQDYETLPTSCNRITSPNAAPLQACYDGYQECTEGTVCRGAACPRTCQTPGAPGDVCQFDSDCRSLLYCKRTVQVTGTGTCTSLGVLNAVCSKDEPCSAELTCAGGRCINAPTADSYCAVGGLCDDTAWCMFTPDGGVCTAKQGSGSPCTDDVQCQSGYICQSGKCEGRVIALVGSPCSDRQTCPMGTTCVGATTIALGRCAEPLMVSESCIASDDCEKHLACAPADGGFALACAFRLPNESSCSVDRDCQLLSRCIAGSCRRLPTTGQSCVEERACLFGPCMGLEDAGSVCAEKYGPGTRCQLDSDCASNRCVSNSCLPSCAP